jgi:hypothetical protein
MPQAILELNVNRVDLVDEGCNSASFIKLVKRKEQDSAMEFDEILAKMKPEHKAVIEAEIEKAKSANAGKCPVCGATLVNGKCPDCEKKMADAKDEVAKAKAACATAEEKAKKLEDEKNTGNTKSQSVEDVMKGLDPAVQEVFKNMQEEVKKSREAAQKAEEARITEEAVAKAKSLSYLPVEQEKLVDVMKSVPTEVFEILKSANKIIGDSGLFEEFGKKKENTAGSTDDAWAQIEKKAEAISAEEKVTKAKAISMAIKQNPDLYRQYLNGGDK